MHKLAYTTIFLSAASLCAQRGPGGGPMMPGGPTGGPSHTVTTSSDYSAFADLGGTVAFDSEANGTAIRRALGVRAFEGSFRGDRASASSSVSRSFRGVSIREFGSVRNADANQGASAGTSSDVAGTTSPTQGAHSVAVNYPNIASGNNAIVTISWFGRASSGASASADVDIDGDGTPDFQGVADGNRASATLQVAAGANGVTIDISTSGSAAVAAAGDESYSAFLSVSVREGTLPTSCTFTNFGNACGADLNGTVGTNLDLSLDVTNAAADAFGFLMVGDQLMTPRPLPMGTCDLLVGRGGRSFGGAFRTDMNGAASISLRSPRMAITTSFQALVISGSRMNGRMIDASNGTELVCQ